MTNISWVRSNWCQIEINDSFSGTLLISLLQKNRQTITNTKLPSWRGSSRYLRRWVTSHLISANKYGQAGWLLRDDLARKWLLLYLVFKSIRTCWGCEGGVSRRSGGVGNREPFGQTETQGSVKVWERRDFPPDDRRCSHKTHSSPSNSRDSLRVRYLPAAPVANSTYINFKRETYGLMSTEKTYGRLPHLWNYAYCLASFLLFS